jgi:hypothetical protein
MSTISTIPNYGGKQPNNSTYVKQFVQTFNNIASWIYDKTTTSQKTISPADSSANVLIQNNLTVNGIITGTIVTPSDISLKENIVHLDAELTDKLMRLVPVQYNYKEAPDKIHYGFIAQETENLFPELTTNINEEERLKAINYLEFIPLLLLQIQDMQKEIAILKKNNLSL